jgi:hypothetical protein
MAETTSSAPGTLSRLDERFDRVVFRLRLLRMALRRLDNLPAALVMAMETSDRDYADWV